MDPCLQRRGFLSLLGGLLPAALLRGAAAPASPRTGASLVNAVTQPSSRPSTAPLLPQPYQPPFDNPGLARWQGAARRPVTGSCDPLLARLLAAADSDESLDIIYYGGTFPGTVRRVAPLVLFTVEGFSCTYLEAHCHWRQEIRTFNTARIAFEPVRLC